MKKSKKSKKENAKTTKKTNVDVELSESELDAISGGGNNPIEEIFKPLTTIPEN